MFERILTMKGTFEGKVVSVLLSIVLVLSMSNVLAFAQVGSALAEDGQGEDVPAVENGPENPRVTISPIDNATIKIGGTLDLNATTMPEGATVQWSSDNTEVATVVAGTGVVTGIAKGTAAITATVKTISGEEEVTATSDPITVTVVEPSVEITPSEDNTVQVDGTLRLEAVTTPAGEPVTWSSGSTDVATVDSAGTVTGVAAGDATITATVLTSDGKPITDSVSVKVANKAPTMPGTITATSDATLGGNGTAESPYIVAPKKTVGLEYQGLSVSTPWKIARGSVPPALDDWNEEDVRDIAQLASQYPVTSESTGGKPSVSVYVYESAPAGARFMVRYNSCISYFKVAEVETEDDPSFTISAVAPTLINEEGRITLEVEGTVQLTATPLSAGETVTWSSGNASVATVGPDGTVTGIKEGTATITATSGGASATITVDVEKNYDITFYEDTDSTEPLEVIKATRNESIVFPNYPETQTVDGKSFKGWSTDPLANALEHYTSHVYAPGSSYTVERDATFYAIWEEQGVDAIFFIRTDKVIPEEPSSHPTKEYTEGIPKDNVIKGAAFYSNQNGIESFLNEGSLPSVDEIKKVLEKKNITYNPETQRVVWYVMKKEKEGWHVDGTVLDNDKATLTYNSNVVDNTVRNIPAGGQCEMNVMTHVSDKTPTRSGGYRFVEWTTQQNGGGAHYAPGAEIEMAQDTTLYAQWESTNCYTVEFYKNDGSEEAPYYVEKPTFNETINFPQRPETEAEGKLFVGWSTDRNANAQGHSASHVYAPGSPYTVKGPAKFYAIWAQQNVGATFFIRTDGKIPEEPSEQPTNLYTKGIPKQTQNVIKRAAFYSNQNGVNEYLNPDTLPTPTEIQKVYPSYKPETQYITWYVIKQEGDGWHVDGVLLQRDLVTLTYSSNVTDNTVLGIPAGSQYDLNAEVLVPSTSPTRSGGYTFAGWNTRQDGTGDRVEPGAKISMSEGKTLYAQWKNLNTYTIKYVVDDADHGTVSRVEETHSVTSVAEVQGSTAQPNVDAGYKFDGWYKDGVKIPDAGENLTPAIAAQKINWDLDEETDTYLYDDTTFEARFVPDQTQTHTVSYKVNYYKDGEFVESDELVKSNPVWVGETATVPVNKQALLNTLEGYEGFKIDHIDLDSATYGEVDSLPNTLETEGTGDAPYVIDVYYVLDDTQTKEVSATVDYQLGDTVQTEDHKDITAEVQVLESGPIYTAGKVVAKEYPGWELDHISLNGEAVKELPGELKDGDKVVYHYLRSENTPPVVTTPTDTNTKPGPDTPPVVTTPTDTNTKPGQDTPPTTTPTDTETEPPTTPQDPAQKPELTPTPETPTPEPGSTPETTPTPAVTPESTPEVAPHSPTGPVLTPALVTALTPTSESDSSLEPAAVPGATTPIAVPTPLMATAAPNPLTTVDVPVNPLGDTTAPSDAAPQSTQESPMGDEGTPLASAPTTIEDGATPLAALMMQETEDGHVGCVVHFYIILGIVLSVVYAAAVALRRAWFSRLLKGYEDDLTGDGGSSDSPAREKASYRPEAAALNGIPAMAAVPVNR
ncbi:Ig-like domain-containing protein [Xiamenia xianingshaonis]|uniref:InlB B-repeat-containing protein n=1 Tax=Xiamenia xianingshaonis TaxID=2682776 RepID=A0A9E6MQY2_9ACTN|nr:Ig-like domain-containing protein [Xiamenia xianingshaonis]NHM14645.1 hypothetical protein [Xiamenia xianingshaonis]QTU84319.1 InlB B-repeat-containing protein [Xiamenia xianingshaonis]